MTMAKAETVQSGADWKIQRAGEIYLVWVDGSLIDNYPTLDAAMDAVESILL